MVPLAQEWLDVSTAGHVLGECNALPACTPLSLQLPQPPACCADKSCAVCRTCKTAMRCDLPASARPGPARCTAPCQALHKALQHHRGLGVPELSQVRPR